MRRRTAAGFGLAALLVLAAGLAGLELARRSRNGAAAGQALAERWLAALASDDLEAALAAARELVPQPPEAPLDPEYIALAEREGIARSFLTAPFNEWDFQSWRHAHFFHTLAREKSRGSPDDVEALFSAVTERIQPQKHPGLPWPYAVWQRKAGVCDRQSWVLCELAYQAGWETQIVYLRDPLTNQSPHTICELRRAPAAVYFADPYRKVLLRQQSVDGVAENSALLTQIWPDRADFRAAVKHCDFWTPAYPQDYCPRNQALARRLEGLLKDRCPRFGEDPHERLALYRQLRGTGGGDEARSSMALWFYPFRLLQREMLQRVGNAPM